MKVVIFLFLSAFSLTLSAQSLDEARKLTLNEQYEEASAMFKQLVDKNPNRGENWFYFGRNLLNADNADSAAILFSKGVEVDPQNPLNYVGMGIIAKMNGDVAGSTKNFERAMQLSGNKNAEVMIRIAEAHIHIDQRNLPQAFSLLKDAEKLDPRNPEIQILTGDAFLENNDGSSAIQHYEKASQLDPKSSLAMLRIAQLWVRARNYSGRDGAKGALEYYKEAIEIDPNFAPAYAGLGELYAKVQRYQEAKENYAKYLELSRNNLNAKIRYASFLFLTKEYAASLSQIREIWQADTSRNMLNRLAAYSSYETKEYQSGLEYIEKFFARQPANKVLTEDYAYYGKLLSATGSDSLGLLQLEIALSQDSTQTDLLGEMAAIYSKTKKHDKAVEMYQRKINANKATVNDYFRMGQSYYNIQEFGKADSAFMKVVEVQPKLPVGYFWRARANASLDPETKEGLAKPFYEQYIELAEPDSARYPRELMEAYKYLGFYYYLNNDFTNSRIWWEKVKAMDPNDKQANEALTDMKGKK